MGNCLVLQEKLIKVVKMDGKVLEYQAPLKVHQVISEFAGHTLSDTLPVYRHLPPDTEMVSGRVYYLLPPPLPSTGAGRRITTVSNPTTEPGHGTGVVRIKIVITKQELKEMLTKGVLSVDEMVSHLQNRQSKDGVDDDGHDNGSSKGWKPPLESIPEEVM